MLGGSRGGEGDASAGSDNIWGEAGVYICGVYLWGIFGVYICGVFFGGRKKSVETCKEGCLGSAACSRPWTG